MPYLCRPASKTILAVSLFSTITHARKRAGYKLIGVNGVHIIIYVGGHTKILNNILAIDSLALPLLSPEALVN